MSSRYASKRKGGGKIEYPGLWSEWAWSDEHQCYYRARLKAPGDYEYDYDQVQAKETPRTVPSPDSTLPQAPTGLYPSPANYTTRSTADVDDLTESLAQTHLGQSSATKSQPQTAQTRYCDSYSAAQTYSSSYQAPTQSYQNYGGPSGSYAQTPINDASVPYPASVLECNNHIIPRDPKTDHEEFDPHYKVHRAREFEWGKIFKVLRSESKGHEAQDSDEHSGSESVSVRKVAGGKEAYAKVRRFMIIKPMKGHCICLPISTYSGKGVNKQGVNADHHAIIYSGKKPVAFRGEKEKGLQMRSIKVTPDNPRHKLDDASRLNYAKTYTVECNVKVWFIGRVSSESEWQVRTDYNRVHPPLETREIYSSHTSDRGDSGLSNVNPNPYYSSTSYESAYPTTGTASSTYGPPQGYGEASVQPSASYTNPYYISSQGTSQSSYGDESHYPAGIAFPASSSYAGESHYPAGSTFPPSSSYVDESRYPAGSGFQALSSSDAYGMYSSSVYPHTGLQRNKGKHKDGHGDGYDEAQSSTSGELEQLDLGDGIKNPGYDDNKRGQKERDKADGQEGDEDPDVGRGPGGGFGGR
ncbi:hypothetical protein V8E51_012770 [Hyaloscypha variabilis]